MIINKRTKSEHICRASIHADYAFVHIWSGLDLGSWWLVTLIVLGVTSAAGGSVAAAPAPIPPGYSSKIIDVKFREGTDVGMPENLLTPELRASVAEINRYFTLPEQTLDEFRFPLEEGEFNDSEEEDEPSEQALPNLNLWFRIVLQPGTDAAAFLDKLNALNTIEVAEPALLPPPPPAITPNFTERQGYLDSAPGGIDARHSWTRPGGAGAGITIYDVEYSWNQTHEDLSKANGIPLLLDMGDTSVDPFNDNNHGTAVLGELIADNDTKGVTGISWDALGVGLAPANTTTLGYRPANAITLAMSDGLQRAGGFSDRIGDVILLEQQAPVCGGKCDSSQVGCGPLEVVSVVFQAIQTAVGNRFVIVEAAGNGNVDLDQTACGDTFDRNVRDSGAIIVGAGGSPNSGLDRRRLNFSTYGDRVDVQGWGNGVTTTGYGGLFRDPDDPDNPDRWYTSTFGGTSSASPIVAGAAANMQGVALQTCLARVLTPEEIRTLLVRTGSPQLGNTEENIGPRPDLRRAIAELCGEVITVDLSITKTDSPDPVSAGNRLTYTLTVRNPGSFRATNVSVTDLLPSAATLDSATSSQGSCSGTNTVTCNLGSLVSGADATVQIVVTPVGTGTISNSATVSADEADPDPTNNTVAQDTTVVPVPVTVTCNRLPLTMGCTVNGVPNQLCQGTTGKDTIVGTAGRDVIHGLDGRDIIRGRRGGDTICGGRGNDSLFGHRGGDLLLGQRGNDALNGGRGTDICMGGRGSDSVVNCE